MNRLPTKQIYLLSVIIVGIIALSVYSTYALFTFEGSTSDIVTIHTPNSLKISENIYEYQQLILEQNSVTSIDIDIYNTFDYEVCYSVWYKIIGESDIQNKVQIFEKTEENLSTSGTLEATTNLRVTIVLINDNENEVKVNIGTIGAPKQEDSCSLNLSNDKHLIVSSYKNTEPFITTILEKKDEIIETEEDYLTYENVTKEITFNQKDKIYISEDFTYKNELFTLTDAKKVTLEELTSEYNLEIYNMYFCLDNNTCQILYKINEIESDNNSKIVITKYNKYIGYSSGDNGLRKINEKDYVYYGDNPNNFIYYNCQNEDIASCELWRVIGFFYNEETKEYNTKIVRNDSIGKYQFDNKITNNINESSNNWSNSTLNKYLNHEYKISNSYDIYTNKYIQSVERITNLETDIKNIKVKDEEIDSKISLLNLSDYLNTSSCQKSKISEYKDTCLRNNWLNNIEISNEWTLTSKEIEELPVINEENEVEENTQTNEENIQENNESDQIENDEKIDSEEESKTNNYVINYVYSIGKDITENDVNTSLDVRPVVFLKGRLLLINGEGTISNPYVVK